MTTAKDFQKIKANPEKYAKEITRINSRLMEKYHNDPEFKARLLQQQKERRQNLKLIKELENKN